MDSATFVEKAKNIAKNYKTLYVNGCFGAPLVSAYYSRYLTNTSYNKKAERQALIKANTNTNPTTFGFDCVCLIKGILWGWTGATNKSYGGATYASNGVPDIGTEEIITVCKNVSSTFNAATMVPGELLWMSGHVGIYIGDGLCIECTPAWKDGVQITAVQNFGQKAGYNSRTWTKHGKLPYVDYTKATTSSSSSTSSSSNSAASTSTSTSTSSTSSNETTVTLPVLKKGDKVAAVKTLQRLLSSLGYKGTDGKVVSVDGSFGGNTYKAVGDFQTKNGIGVDYTVGPKTWTKLLSGSQV